MIDNATRPGGAAYGLGTVLAVAAGLLIGWMNAAVGIAGNEDNPVNLVFFGLVAMAAVGAFACDGGARGLARTMACVAAIQLMLGAIVATGPVAAHEPAGGWGLFALNGGFALLWLGAAVAFAKAARGGHD
jgi:hypothetical protein